MKTLKIFLILSSIFIGTSVFGQAKIDNLLKECEIMDSKDMEISVVQTKNKETKKLESRVVNINIYNNKELVSRFIKAFNEERDNAYQVIDNKEADMVNLFYTFHIDGRDVSYYLTVEGKSSATVGMTVDYKNSR